MFYQQMYDIAIVRLAKAIPVHNGFRLRQAAKQDYNIDKVEVAGFPATVTPTKEEKLKTTHGIMYH